MEKEHEMKFKQNKGKDLDKIPKSKLDEIGPYYISRKYDGHYVQVVYDGEDVSFYTSGGKEFYLSKMAQDIKKSDLPSFAIECEYLYGCSGRLGDRGKSAKLTTYRTNYSKGIETTGHPLFDVFVVLDILEPYKFSHRLDSIEEYFDDWSKWFLVPLHYAGTVESGKKLAFEWNQDGYEGAMLKHMNHWYEQGKRTNDIIKIKPRLTADLLCIGVTEGEGKYEGLIGALLLVDSYGREVSVGSGLSDFQRSRDYTTYVGKIIEIAYERIDSTYIQPTFKEVRLDKSVSD